MEAGLATHLVAAEKLGELERCLRETSSSALQDHAHLERIFSSYQAGHFMPILLLTPAPSHAFVRSAIVLVEQGGDHKSPAINKAASFPLLPISNTPFLLRAPAHLFLGGLCLLV